MTRLKQAWLALCGKLEPVVKEVPVPFDQYVYGAAEEVEIYVAEDPKARIRAYCLGPIKLADWHGRGFLTCSQALAECQGANVSAVKLWKIAGNYYNSPNLRAITVQPKPKVAKGKRK